jgi:hypothetical protein
MSILTCNSLFIRKIQENINENEQREKNQTKLKKDQICQKENYFSISDYNKNRKNWYIFLDCSFAQESGNQSI